MSNLEGIIRPFQIGDVFDARTLTPPAQPNNTPKADIIEIWGDDDSSDYQAYQLSGLIGGKVIYKEKSRVTSTHRIFNPEDSGQFVDVKRIDKLVLASDKGDEIHFQMNNT